MVGIANPKINKKRTSKIEHMKLCTSGKHLGINSKFIQQLTDEGWEFMVLFEENTQFFSLIYESNKKGKNCNNDKNSDEAPIQSDSDDGDEKKE